MGRGGGRDIAEAASLPDCRVRALLPEEEIHLWYFDLDQSAAHEAWLASSLGRAERVAADQFFFTLDRRRFITRRGVLRLILSEYLEIGPADLSFRVNANGKPELTGSDIRFSVSHSAGLAAYALSWRCELGVDIERLRPLPDALQIAAAFFSSSERSSLEALPAADQLTAFFRCWTRKEAFVKALGEGLSYPLDQFEVFSSPG